MTVVSGEARIERSIPPGGLDRERPANEEVLLLTKAKTLRRIEPGMMVTHDFREDRVTIESDPKTGRVVSAKCE